MTRHYVPRRQRRVIRRIIQDVSISFLCCNIGVTLVLHGADTLGRVAGVLLLVCAAVFAHDARRAWLITKPTC